MTAEEDDDSKIASLNEATETYDLCASSLDEALHMLNRDKQDLSRISIPCQ